MESVANVTDIHDSLSFLNGGLVGLAAGWGLLVGRWPPALSAVLAPTAGLEATDASCSAAACYSARHTTWLCVVLPPPHCVCWTSCCSDALSLLLGSTTAGPPPALAAPCCRPAPSLCQLLASSTALACLPADLPHHLLHLHRRAYAAAGHMEPRLEL